MNTQTVVIIQARMGSTRLPCKVLEPIAGIPLLGWVIERVQDAAGIDKIILATTDSASDKPIVDYCNNLGVEYFCGSERDVLDRFLQAARKTNATHIIRVNADNPFIDPEFLETLIDLHTDEDYISFQTTNKKPAMLTAISFFAEFFTRECLERAAKSIQSPYLREHVTLGIYQNPEEYKVRFVTMPAFVESIPLRLTIDTAEDLALIREICQTPGLGHTKVTARQIVDEVSQHVDWLQTMRRINLQQSKG